MQGHQALLLYFFCPKLGVQAVGFFAVVLHAIQGRGNFGRLSARFNYRKNFCDSPSQEEAAGPVDPVLTGVKVKRGMTHGGRVIGGDAEIKFPLSMI